MRSATADLTAGDGNPRSATADVVVDGASSSGGGGSTGPTITAEVDVTLAEMLNLADEPVPLVDGPGSGKILEVVRWRLDARPVGATLLQDGTFIPLCIGYSRGEGEPVNGGNAVAPIVAFFSGRTGFELYYASPGGLDFQVMSGGEPTQALNLTGILGRGLNLSIRNASNLVPAGRAIADGVEITEGGADYSVGDYVFTEGSIDADYGGLRAHVTAVDGAGAITGFDLEGNLGDGFRPGDVVGQDHADPDVGSGATFTVNEIEEPDPDESVFKVAVDYRVVTVGVL